MSIKPIVLSAPIERVQSAAIAVQRVNKMGVKFPYSFPTFPNVETRQIENPLPIAEQKGIAYNTPSRIVSQNANPNVYAPQGDIAIPGTQVFGQGRGYDSFPQPLDIIHREIHINVNHPVLYRSNYSAPRMESPARRVFAISNTAPANTATFLNGKKGDVYGS